MARTFNRFYLYIAACSVAGVILGGTTSRAELAQCQSAATPSLECLTTHPTQKTLEGMAFGLLAGAGAAVGATWQMREGRDR